MISTSIMWFNSVCWLQPKCTWKALCRCILWGLKYILCSAPVSSTEWKIKNVDQQTWLIIISVGHALTVQYCLYSAVYHWAVTPQSSQCSLYQIILHSGLSHLNKHSPLSSRTFWGHFLCPPAPHWPACRHMMEPSGHSVKESVHVLLGDTPDSGRLWYLQRWTWN